MLFSRYFSATGVGRGGTAVRALGASHAPTLGLQQGAQVVVRHRALGVGRDGIAVRAPCAGHALVLVQQ